MTQAICLFRGKSKFGAFSSCDSCRKEPVTENDRFVSLLLTDHYFDLQSLEAIGQNIIKGKELVIDPKKKSQRCWK
ncbi:hypothetical protein ACFL3I_12470 [Pseudomonadota bacterium]